MKLTILIFLIAVQFYQCASSKDYSYDNNSTSNKSKQPDTSEDMVEVNKPFQSKEYRSDKDYFRAVSSAESENLSFSSEKALLLTKQRLASLISDTIKSASESYANDIQISEKMQYKDKTERMVNSVVNQTMNDANVIGEKTLKSKTSNRYLTYIALEVPKETVKKEIKKQIVKEELKELDNDKEKFIDRFNQLHEENNKGKN